MKINTFGITVLTVLAFLAILAGFYALINFPVIVFGSIGMLFIACPVVIGILTVRTEKRKSVEIRDKFLSQFE